MTPLHALGAPWSHRRAVVGWTGPSLPPPQAAVPYHYGLEQALIDSFKREAMASSSSYANAAGVSVVAYLRGKGGRSASDGQLLIKKIECSFSPWTVSAVTRYPAKTTSRSGA